jgi:hypothetical protein
MEKERIFCKICNVQTNLTIDSFSRYHLKPNHNMNMKEYYDKCIKIENEGKCLHCGKYTKFIGYYKGYAKFCSQKHQRISEYIRKKISESFNNRDINKENEKRKKTNLEKYGREYVAQVDEFQDKWKKTNLEKYGKEHTLDLDKCKKRRVCSLKKNKKEINEKRKKFWRNLTEAELSIIIDKKRKTFEKKYGVEWNSQVEIIKEKIRLTNEKNGNWLNNRSKNDFLNYKNKVRNETLKHRIKLFKDWNGLDYYTGNILSYENYKMYPTVDHKISKYYGFINNIDPKEIGSFKNLCICSRSTNAKKNKMIEKEFRKKLNENKNKVY